MFQVQLQNMLSSKFIAHFLQEVSSWQKKLSTADQVIQIWMEVQRTWSHLESIFIGSEDIRNQLPEDSKRFDGIDSDFKVSRIFIPYICKRVVMPFTVRSEVVIFGYQKHQIG